MLGKKVNSIDFNPLMNKREMLEELVFCNQNCSCYVKVRVGLKTLLEVSVSFHLLTLILP